jgi:hypothetical protein
VCDGNSVEQPVSKLPLPEPEHAPDLRSGKMGQSKSGDLDLFPKLFDRHSHIKDDPDMSISADNSPTLKSFRRRASVKGRSLELDAGLEFRLMKGLSRDLNIENLLNIDEETESAAATPLAKGKHTITCRALNTYTWVGSAPCSLIKMP